MPKKKPIPLRSPTRADYFILAAETGLGLKTVQKAFAQGVSSLRAEADRDRLRLAAARYSIEVPA